MARQQRREINTLTDIIRKEQIISDELLDEIIEIAAENNTEPANILLQGGHITKNQLTEFIAKTFHSRYMDLSEKIIDQKMSRTLPVEIAKKYKIVPVEESGRSKLIVAVSVGMAKNLEINDRVRQLTGYSSVEFVVSPTEQIENTIKEIYRVDDELEQITKAAIEDVASQAINNSVEALEDEGDINDESPIERFVRLALTQAIEDGASDIILQSREEGLKLRYRIDGRWYSKETAPHSIADEIISVVKIRANLDISIRKTGQDGRMDMIYNGKKIDFRVNVFPVQDGENITMRILDNSAANKKLDELGFSAENLERFMSAINKPQGLILVTGPTGSGKSVTLYAGLNVIANEHNNTYTIEDPIEYRIDNVVQSQIDPKSNWTYPKAIESLLRAAPDNILIGEIRNKETAHMALEAGMTGHLVLSTLHTNSAAEAAARLIDMGAEPDVVSMTLTAIIAQRLVRTLCNRCKVEVVPNPAELLRVGFPWEEGTPLPRLYGPSENGCKECRGLGFKGRTGAHEVLLIDDAVKELILRRSNARAIEDAAMENGMLKMMEDGFQKVLQGITTIPELFRSITTS